MSNFYGEKWQRPYLTPSLAVTLLTKSPFHARLSCPFFGPVDDVSTQAMSEGRIVDTLVLGGDPDVTVLDYDEFRTKEARAARDAAVNPMKQVNYQRCVNAATEVSRKIAEYNRHAYEAIDLGIIKERVFWESNGVHCSTEPDVFYSKVYDLKRTKIAPTAENWARHVSRYNMHIQVAAGLEATGADKFGWIVVEADPPHCVVVHWASALMIQIGRRDWEYAKSVWRNCLEHDHFPAYESGEIDPMGYLVGDMDDITFTEGEE